jgi:hypothetical protein
MSSLVNKIAVGDTTVRKNYEMLNKHFLDVILVSAQNIYVPLTNWHEVFFLGF